MDFLDDWIFGPLNLIDRLHGLIRGIGYGDLGHKFTVRYADRGGHHSRAEIEALLNKYGIAVYGRTHDANCMHFLVKKRQARWAEYLLRKAGAALVGDPVSESNATIGAGKMPAAWIERELNIWFHPARRKRTAARRAQKTSWRALWA